MLKKLKSVLAGPKGSILPLALKSAALGILLFLAISTGNWFFVAVFIIASCYFYFFPAVNSVQFLASFLTLLALPALFYQILNSNFFLLVALFYIAAFFIILGVKNLVFINRRPIYCFLNGILILAVFSLFFWSDRTNNFFFVKYLLTFSAFFFLFREFLEISSDGLSEQKKKLFIWSVSFLVFQIVWALSFLPINFLNAGALVLLIVLIFEDFISRHLLGTIDRRAILRNVTVFVVMALAIFGASSWSL